MRDAALDEDTPFYSPDAPSHFAFTLVNYELGTKYKVFSSLGARQLIGITHWRGQNQYKKILGKKI
jgi:hypothetical protein